MNKTRTFILFILTFLTFQLLYSDPVSISGRIVNGRGGIEKCDNLRIKLLINSQAKALTYTDASGVFSFETTGLAEHNAATPGDFALDQNYPNPFMENTTLPYTVNTPGSVKLDVYDIRGQKIRSLVHNYRTNGQYNSRWNGRNEQNQLCPQGIYFYVLEMNGSKDIRKMTLTNNSMSGAIIGSQMPLSKSSGVQIVELIIEDNDIENKTVSYTYSELPASLDLGDIPVHIYPFLLSTPEPLYVIEGQDVFDTLDIYFEKPFSISSTNVDLDWSFTPDSNVAIHYKNVTKSSITLSLREDGGTQSSYINVNFDLDQKAEIWPYKLQRALVGRPYAQDILTEDEQGDLSITLTNTLPSPLTLNGRTIEGTPTSASETILYFDLEDDRQVVFHDSALLVISEQNEVSFNNYVVDVLEEYHRDGRYPYSWVSGYHGVTRDLYYLDSKIASANPDSSHSTYCSGLTFEIYFRSITRMSRDLGLGEDINGLTYTNIKNFMSIWYVQSTLGDGPGLALPAYGLGERISEMKDLQTGDFVQIWRTTGSGHSVIFMNWTTNAAGDTTGMRYWSTQTSTNGVNYNTEYFSGLGGTVDKAHTYYSRGSRPEDFENF